MREQLESLIESLVTEVLRGFNLNKFKTLSTFEDRIKYANSVLPKLGKGSSRIVFAISGDKVLKIARNPAGVAQNGAELELYTSPNTKPVVAKIYDADPGNNWLISEIVQPFKGNRQEWEAATGFDYSFLASVMKDWENDDMPEETAYMQSLVTAWQNRLTQLIKSGQNQSQYYKITQRRVKNYIRMSKSPLVMGIFGLLRQGLLRADVANINAENTSNNVIGHFGKTIDGRVVLLDYGYTDQVWDEHYRESQEAQARAEAEEAAAEAAKIAQDKNPTASPESSDEEPRFVSTGHSLK